MSFEKNNNLDNLIVQINDLLEPLEREKVNAIDDDKNSFPVLLLLGAPRSGSTLFTQWAASLELFAYPSNFLSRFYKAPYIGALIYKLVTDPAYQYRGEFSDINQKMEFTSSIGKTSGFKAPHEFWYFWRRFFQFPEIPCNEEEFEERFDFNNFRKELFLLTEAFEKPFLFKAHIVNWYAKSLYSNVNELFFIHLHREPVSSIRSLLNARENWKGNIEEWFSFKPKEYALLEGMDKYHQVAGQIYFIEKEIIGKKTSIGDRCLTISYENFCKNPKEAYQRISEHLQVTFPLLDIPEYKGPTRFEVSNPISEDDNKISSAYNFFEDAYGKLIY